MNISIFAKRAFLNINSSQEFQYNGKSPQNGHLLRVSSMIRADQVATQIGAKLNPKQGYSDDLCIYVKPHVARGNDFVFEGAKPYLDIVDGWGLIPVLEKHPEIPVIACSSQDASLLTRILKNKIVLIPQHHCNFERLEKGDKQEINTVGIIGTQNAFGFLPDKIRTGLKRRGIKLVEYSRFFTRQNIIDFYNQIDVQIVWRPYRMRLSNPLKIVNAASFGVPTIAYEESVFNEVRECYMPVKNVEQFFEALDVLKDFPAVYNSYSEECKKKAEKYHIENIGKLYEQL